MRRDDIIRFAAELLEADRFQDYAPNGLQVEGKNEVRKVALGVSANQALLDAALAWGADMVLVHHGWFWRGESPRVTGPKARRLRTLLTHDVSLAAFHLPLDAHPEVGNNAELARRLGLETDRRGGSLGLLSSGAFPEPRALRDVLGLIERVLDRPVLVLGPAEPERKISRMGWCSGAAQDELAEAAQLGCELYLTGEVSERTTHEALELGVTFVCGGHHATERFGIQALGARLEEAFPGLEARYFEVPNPV